MKKILLVDDDEAILEFLQAKLGSRYALITTNDAEKVVQLAREQAPDLIVCDVDMPDMDGGDVSAALYDDDETRDIPLLFLTGLASPADLKQNKGQIGGRAAISKNTPIDQLVARIESLIKT
jgi:CheY-like chemotaxis protein